MEAQLEEKNQELQRVKYYFALYLATYCIPFLNKIKVCLSTFIHVEHLSWDRVISGEAEGEDE